MKENSADKEQKLDDLSMLLDMESPDAVFKEVRDMVESMSPGHDFRLMDSVFLDVRLLFSGGYPNYQRCNTEYHDLRHTTDVLLCCARYLHGMYLSGVEFSPQTLDLTLVSALMHDTGYIQHDDDCDGTGAKYTTTHVKRSIDFARMYFEENSMDPSYFEVCRNLIAATEVSSNLEDMPFASNEQRLAGKALISADLLGQMADRIYLEKLLFLFLEFKEGGVLDFNSEAELLENTVGFYNFVRSKLEGPASYDTSAMKLHFSNRHKMDRDLYLEAVENNMGYLGMILSKHRDSYRAMLNRGGIVERLEKAERLKSAEA